MPECRGATIFLSMEKLIWRTEKRRIGDLVAYEHNPRFMTPEQEAELAASLERFNLAEIPAIDTNNRIVAGHQRIRLLIKMGKVDELIDVRVPNRPLTEDEFREYLIRSNANTGSWDTEILAQEFDLPQLEGWGLDEKTLKSIPQSVINAEEPEEVIPPAKSVVQLGDIFLVNAHITLCGNSEQSETYDKLMNEELAQIVFTDPPYNVKIDNIVNLGKTQHREFARASGEMSEDEFVSFLTNVYQLMIQYTIAGSIHYICMDWEHAQEMLKALNNTYGKDVKRRKDWFKNRCTWVKDNGGMGTMYRSKSEDIYVVKNGHNVKHINNFELGQYGRYRTNVWEYAGTNSFTNRPKGADGKTTDTGDQKYHPTVKPTELVADALLDCSMPGGIVLDPFSGSGTTMLAAEKTGRKARLIELDPIYVEVGILRMYLFCSANNLPFQFKHVNGSLTINDILANNGKIDLANGET